MNDKMRQLTIEENKVLIEAARILKDSHKNENSFIISIQDFPVKVPKTEDIKTFFYVNLKSS